MIGQPPELSVADFVASLNQTLNMAYPAVIVVGEVAEFNVSQGKFVFFKLKDETATISCFMMAFKMSTPLENGMKIRILAVPKVRDATGFLSLNVAKYQPVGEGSIKKALELLKKKLEKEGLFDKDKKRPLPDVVQKIAVISSVDSAGYRDFIKILGERAGGLELEVINTAVQGLSAPEEIIRALKKFNERAVADVIVIVRGGGSKDDLSAFNDEAMARAIRASRLPVLVGVGHEVDESIADLVADVRASTPTHAAQLLTPKDRRETVLGLANMIFRMEGIMQRSVRVVPDQIRQILQDRFRDFARNLAGAKAVLGELNPEKVLERGYAIISGKVKPNETLKITTKRNIITSRVEKIEAR
jgi:exodeoxyribonuclease VII large subunit